MEKYIKLESVDLKKHNEINEKWVQQKIEREPSILGLGDLELRQSEKVQQSGGRIDMLFQDDSSDTRYTVELQLGKTDETHIIRTIEYWDNERKRNQNYKYVAVIIAENITNRFFNVISLFNGSIPLIAIQLKAIKYKDEIGLDFTTILDLNISDEEEDIGETVDREHWNKKASKITMNMVDKLLINVSEFVDGFVLKYNKYYIGLIQNDIAKNFISFKPNKTTVVLSIKHKKSQEIDRIIDNSNLDQLAYENQWNQYRFRLKEKDIEDNKETLLELFKLAYESYTGNKIES